LGFICVTAGLELTLVAHLFSFEEASCGLGDCGGLVECELGHHGHALFSIALELWVMASLSIVALFGPLCQCRHCTFKCLIQKLKMFLRNYFSKKKIKKKKN
jgi:hypothetical protein